MGALNYAQAYGLGLHIFECLSRQGTWWRLSPLQVWMAVGSKELIRPLLGFVFHPARCPHTLFTQVALGEGAGLVANYSTMGQVLQVYMVPVADRLPDLTCSQWPRDFPIGHPNKY